ncbi:MAG: translation initiation factor IF-2 [Acidobacteria bacterium]|nr:translation initiation factor IF-2 [Acidobacteriota bacterium]
MSDVAKKMGKSEKDVIFQLQSLGADVTDASQVLEPEVIQALITGKKLVTRTRSVIMREDKPQPEKKKEAVRPPRPIIKPVARPKREVPVEEAPVAPPPSVVIQEFLEAAEAEERAAKEAPAPQPAQEKPRVAAAAPEHAPEPPAPVEAEVQQPPAAAAAAPEQTPATPPPAAPQPPPAQQQPMPPQQQPGFDRRPTGPTGPRARAPQGPRPNYANQPPAVRPGAPMGNQQQRPPMAAGPAGQQQRPPMGGQRPPMGGQGPRPGGPGGPRPGGPMGQRPGGPMGQRPGGPMGQRPGGPMGARPGGPGRPMGAPPPPPGPGGLIRRKKVDEEQRPEKKKTTGKRGKSERPSEVDNELFTKGPFSGTQIIADDLGPDIVMPAEGEEEARPTSNRRDARKQASPVSGRVLEFKRPTGKVALTEGVTVKELADKLGVKANDLMRHLMMKKGIMASVNQPLGADLALEIARDLGIEAEMVSFEEAVELEAIEKVSGGNVPRGPVITVMGHVDHGKTSLLDAIRETNVAAGEAGGITQHIGAYHVEKRGRKIVFLDTPGHEAFTMMRARGAKVTDIVILVVAADDGVMPQTKEAIDHARAAKVPMIVAINKIDKPNANVDRVRRELAENGVQVEQWGGDVVSVEVSALKKQGIDDLLDMILLTADLLDLKANPEMPAKGIVLEAKKETGRGVVATVLVQDGTIKITDPFFSGSTSGRVRAMMDERGERIQSAGPATPVQVTGFDDVPNAGDMLQVVDEQTQARMIGQMRQEKARETSQSKSASRMSLDQLFQRMQSGTVKELNLIIKADVQGSVEVLGDTMRKLSTPEVKVNVIHASVGAISTNDVLLATASDAIVVGFNVRPERNAAELADKEGVDIRLYTVIYTLVDEMKAAMTGLLDPKFQEVFQGRAEVRNTFKVPKAGVIAGCMVLDGIIPRTASIRLLRDNRVILEGKIASLRHFKNDVAEVRQGFECGIGIEKFQDIKVGDIIEAFKIEQLAAALTQ